MSKKEKSISSEEEEMKQESPADQVPETIPGQSPETPASTEPATKAADASAVEQLTQQLLRLQADFDNFRKRVTRERAEWFQRANQEMMEEMLPVVDHFEMGLKTARDGRIDAPVQEGFKLVYDQLINLLTKFNLKAVDAIGETFDPHQHEAVTYIPSETVEEGKIIEQIRRGYLLGDKLLRPAQVVVSMGSTPKQA